MNKALEKQVIYVPAFLDEFISELIAMPTIYKIKS